MDSSKCVQMGSKNTSFFLKIDFCDFLKVPGLVYIQCMLKKSVNITASRLGVILIITLSSSFFHDLLSKSSGSLDKPDSDCAICWQI